MELGRFVQPTARISLSLPPVTTQRPSEGDSLPELTSLQQDVAGKKLVMDARGERRHARSTSRRLPCLTRGRGRR